MTSARAAAWMFRTIATVMLFAGLGLLTAAIATSATGASLPVVASLAGILLQTGGVLVVTGITAAYLSRRRGLLPNELRTVHEPDRPPVGDWLIVMALALVALPVWLVFQLQPFLAEWRTVMGLLSTPSLWDGAGSGLSGIVFLPIAAALAPPFIELAAMALFVASSIVLVLLLASRSDAFPRVFLVSVVLMVGMVIASERSDAAAGVAADGVRQLLEGSNARPEESVQITAWVGRYTRAVHAAATALIWALCGYLVWLPFIFTSSRVRTTYATVVAPSAEAAGIEAITRPPRFPG